jgi:hypothetical protein
MRIVRTLAVLGLAGLCLGTLPQHAPALFPQPSVYPVAWELDFVADTPKRIVVEIPGESVPRAYWYMTYVATNHTGQKQIFLPTFELLTKEGRVLKSDTESSAAVFQAVAQREARKPLKPALELAGEILEGEDMAKYGVAIWPEYTTEPGSFSIFVSGLSGETAPLTDSEGRPMTDADGNPILLRKTKQLDYTVRGDEIYAGDPIVKTSERWIMR